MVITKNHPNCQKCQLFSTCKTPWMESAGADEPIILVIGEAPGENEDESGLPFVGRSGKLLRETLADAEIDVRNDVRFTNVVRCRPPDNKISKKAITSCKHFAEAEIEYYQPQLVLLMGNSPLNAILGESGISNWNGVTVERDGVVYVPLYHPAYILRNPAAADEWIQGLDRALEALLDGVGEPDVTYLFPSTVREVEDMADWLLSNDEISYDTETGSLDPFHPNNSIPCVSFAAGNRSYAVPVDHQNSPWSVVERDKVLITIQRILTSPGAKIIGHNIKFDQNQTRRNLGMHFRAYGDTMLVSHMLDSRQGIHGLKRLAGLHLGMYDYDKELDDYKAVHPECNPDKGGSYANIPLEILLPYAAKDTYATLALWNKLYPTLSNKQQHLLHEIVMPTSNTLADLEYNGNNVDLYVAQRYAQLYTYEQERIMEMLLDDDRVQATVAWLQKQADMKVTMSLPAGSKWSVNHEYIHYTADTRAGKRKRNLIEFNPNSPDHLKRLYFHECGIPIQELTESGQPSTSAAVMKAVAMEYPIVNSVVYYRLLTKMLGTYIMPAATGAWLSGDGRVRSTYNLHGTRTSRLSSSNPNMQNIPTPEKEADNNPMGATVWMPIKNIFTHSWGAGNGVLMSVDYSGMELRVFASLARCFPMIEIHKSGADFHSMVAIMAQTGRQPGSISIDETKKFKKEHQAVRYRYKWTNWTLLYGGDEYTLISLYGMGEQEAKETVRSYYDTFPEVLEFRQWTQQFAEDNGYIESPYGRREHLPYINDNFQISHRNKDRRAAVNMPVQSAASDTLLCSLVVIHDKLRRGGFKTMLVNTVHDSIVLDVPNDEIDDVAALCVDVMENIVSYGRDYFPNIDFSWLICPLKADVEVGTHYGAEMSLKEWKESHGMPTM